MRFLLDENLSPLHAEKLRALDYDAVSAVEMGLCGAEDSKVRATAIETDRILITLDGDFANVLRYPPSQTPGIIRLRLHPPTEKAIEAAISWAVPRLADIDLRGKLVVVDETRIRMRKSDVQVHIAPDQG